MPQIDVNILRNTLDTSTGVSYIPCIIHKLLYNKLCDNRCYCRNACLRLKLGVLK